MTDTAPTRASAGARIAAGLAAGPREHHGRRLADAYQRDDAAERLLALRETRPEAYDALPAVIDDSYRTALSTLGQQVRVELPGGRAVPGRAVDVDRDGRLVVLDECGISHHFDAADVVHLR